MSVQLRQNPDDALRLERAQAAIRSLERDNATLRNALADRSEVVDAIIGSIEPRPSFARPPRHKGKSKPVVRLCVALTDWHIGECVRADEMGGSNAYNLAIAEAGILDIARRIIRYADNARQTYTIDEVCLFSLGDMVTGEIHPQDAIGLEFPVTRATVKAGELLGEVYATFAPEFRTLRALQVGAGNHDRNAAKVPSKRAVEASFSDLYHAIANQRMAATQHFHAETPTDLIPSFDIGGSAVAATHGDGVRMYLRLPYAGLRDLHNSIRNRRTSRGLPPQVLTMVGHFHSFAMILDGDVMVCPSLMGPNEYSQKAGFNGEPGQVAYLLGEHGPFNVTVFERRTGRSN